jgi:hypothetical protein
MKKVLSILFAGLIPAMLSVPGAKAQGSSANKAFDSSKSLLASTAIGDKSANDATSVNFRALRDFSRKFKLASDTRWHKVSDGFVADYLLAGIKCKSAYNNKGSWVYTIRYYGEKQLPTEVRNLVRSTYFDFTITQVEEVSVPENLIYLVHIQDGNAWKIVHIADGEMNIYKEGQSE